MLTICFKCETMGTVMNHRKIRIGFIGSTGNFLECAGRLTPPEEFEAHFAQAGLDEAIPIGQRMEQQGVEVVVSRRGTGHLLRENLSVPVLSVPLTSFELLSNIKEAARLGRKILLTAFRSEVTHVELLEELFDIEIVPGVFTDSNGLEDLILNGQRQGCQVVVGGGVTKSLANRHGLAAVEVQTSEDAMGSTIENARSAAFSYRREHEKSLRYQTIIDSISEGILAVDRHGRVTTINRVALNFLHLESDRALGRSIKNLSLPGTITKVMEEEKPQGNQLEKISRETYLVSHVPVMDGQEVIGGISTYRDIPNVMKAENEVRRSLAKRFVAKYHIGDLIHKSLVMKDLVRQAENFARTDSTVLLLGETGTGKELLAHSLHRLGPRRSGPFVSINCAALPDQLLESELFGHEEGAFTGSRRGGKPGLFELAHNGTIFLDEMGATPPNLQARLLRVLQEREVMRIGGDRLIPINVRVIAATNQNLGQEVLAGRFREDLFFRLDILTLKIPPLRERIEDLPLLVEALIERATPTGVKPLRLPPESQERLMRLAWPGNVRQLNNFIEKLVILSGNGFSRSIFNEIYRQLHDYRPNIKPDADHPAEGLSDLVRRRVLEDEARLILRALEENAYNKTEAARHLGISRVTLWRKLKALNLGE